MGICFSKDEDDDKEKLFLDLGPVENLPTNFSTGDISYTPGSQPKSTFFSHENPNSLLTRRTSSSRTFTRLASLDESIVIVD